MYKVVMTLMVWSEDKNYITDYHDKRDSHNRSHPLVPFDQANPSPKPKYYELRHELSIPFAPFIGLQIRNGNFESPPIEQVIWDHAKDHFRCEVESAYTVDHMLHAKYEELVEMYLEKGWVLAVSSLNP